MSSKIKKYIILLIMLVVIYISYSYIHTSYSEYSELLQTVKNDFKPQGFININEERENIYNRITSYPSDYWGGNNNNAYKGNIIKPKQVDFYYTTENSQIISKVTMVYSPYSVRKKYTIVDYFEELKEKSVVNEYDNVLVTPYYQVGFKGKGYTAFVTSLYTENFFKSKTMTIDEKDTALSQNAKLVRELQNFLKSQ